jgi:hypothetical protein
MGQGYSPRATLLGVPEQSGRHCGQKLSVALAKDRAMPKENGELDVYRRDGVSVVQLRTGGGKVRLSYRAMADF